MNDFDTLKLLVKEKKTSELYNLKTGKNINQTDKSGKTILMWACIYHSCEETFEILFDKGADYRLCDNEGKTALDYAETLEKKLSIYVLDQLGKTIRDDLFKAVEKNDLETIIYYVEDIEADINIRDSFSCHLLKKAFEKEKTDIVKYLIKKGASTDCLDESEMKKIDNYRKNLEHL